MLIDIGANLTHDDFRHDLDALLDRAYQAGISNIIVTGASIPGSVQAADLACKHPKLYATAGIHPHHAEESSATSLAKIRELVKHPKVKAVGETGLDFFRDFASHQAQIASFEAHIAIAIETNLPMFLHEREAHATFLDILKAYRGQLSKIVVHCFTGRRDVLHKYLELDCHIGFTGWICDERRGTHLLPIMKDVPLNRIMIETDAPYLLPRNIEPKPKSRRNEPRYLPVVCQTAADAIGISFQALAEHTSKNAQLFFDLN